jgi:YjbE family integral membrane protein
MFDWLALGKIIWIDILLSGDNALVIAMACRSLPARQRLWGMILGAGAAVLIRIFFTGIVSQILLMPYLKLFGGTLLLYVACKLLMANDDEPDVKAKDKLLSAIGVIALADIVMSLDNVIAVAAAANGSVLLLCIGLALSIPLIVTGASIIVGILNRFPILIWAGGALLGYIAGEVMATDPIIPYIDGLEIFGGVIGLWFVVMFGAFYTLHRIRSHA